MTLTVDATVGGSGKAPGQSASSVFGSNGAYVGAGVGLPVGLQVGLGVGRQVGLGVDRQVGLGVGLGVGQSSQELLQLPLQEVSQQLSQPVPITGKVPSQPQLQLPSQLSSQSS